MIERFEAFPLILRRPMQWAVSKDEAPCCKFGSLMVRDVAARLLTMRGNPVVAEKVSSQALRKSAQRLPRRMVARSALVSMLRDATCGRSSA
jgi:hypothetical protein